MRLTILFIFLLFGISCSNNQSNKHIAYNKLGLDTTADTYSVIAEDPSMNSAIGKAKSTIHEFDEALKSKNLRYTDFAVKKRYRTSDGGGEHMWIAGIVLKDGYYRGFVNNDAEKTTEVKYGDTVIVLKDEITDWMYLDSNVLRGGYTIRAVRNQLSEDERIKMDKNLGFKIEE